MFRKLTRDQRSRVAEKIMELGNLIFIGLVITQVFSNTKFNAGIAGVGFIILIITYTAAIKLMRGGGK